jgi:oxygen-independent coproporphyrinogen-3 oxidase
MKPSQILAARVPRYTSYPTAPHFSEAVNGPVYRAWLDDLPDGMPLSLYLHVPFCDTLCWFCGCHTTVVNNYRPVSSFLETLLLEMRLVAEQLGARRRVSHIHWGGGSPTLLSPIDIARLNAETRKLFDVLPESEFAVEVDPRDFKPATAEALAAAGLTRASIGVQDCDPKVQTAINRVQTDAETRQAIDLLRRWGVDHINLDLIYGLPYQTCAGIQRNLEFAHSLQPGRLAVFGYAHVPSFKKHQGLIPEAALPGLEERLEQEALIHERLLALGYRAIGLDHYARAEDSLGKSAADGGLRRNFQGYTTDDAPALIGFGPSAISRLPQGYGQNAVSTHQWRSRIEAGEFAIRSGIALTWEDRVRGHVIERLMCDMAVDLAAVSRTFALPRRWFAAELDKLQPLKDAQLISITGDVVAVTGPFRQAARLAAAAFDTRLDGSAKRHTITA